MLKNALAAGFNWMEIKEILRIYVLSAAADVNPPGFYATTAELQIKLHTSILRGITLYVNSHSLPTQDEPGGGRKLKRVADSTLLTDLRRLVEPATRSDPMRTLLWTSKSLRHLSQALAAKGHSLCAMVVADCLRELGYSLQANRKTREGGGHMDRDAQFQYLNDQATAFLRANEPVISVDTKKKELVGNYKNNGREWRPQANPEAVNVRFQTGPRRPLRSL